MLKLPSNTAGIPICMLNFLIVIEYLFRYVNVYINYKYLKLTENHKILVRISIIRKKPNKKD